MLSKNIPKHLFSFGLGGANKLERNDDQVMSIARRDRFFDIAVNQLHCKSILCIEI